MSETNICPFCDDSQAYRHITTGRYIRAIFPKNPACSFHVLLTPTRHVAHLDLLTPEEWSELGLLLREFTSAATAGLDGYIGFNVLSNNGDERVNQRVQHAHVHLFLRAEKDTEDPIRAKHAGAIQDLSNDELRNLETLKVLVKNTQL